LLTFSISATAKKSKPEAANLAGFNTTRNFSVSYRLLNGLQKRRLLLDFHRLILAQFA